MENFISAEGFQQTKIDRNMKNELKKKNYKKNLIV